MNKRKLGSFILCAVLFALCMPVEAARWEDLETFARQGIQTWLQRLLEEEVDELLGRRRYERRARIDAPAGHRKDDGAPGDIERERT